MVSSLRLQHFRSYDDASFEFGEQVNIIVGPNGSGKTNLLEAIQALCIGKSYRADDAELVQFNQDWARLDATTIDNQTRTVKLTKAPRQMKTYEFDGVTVRRLTERHVQPVVLFEPNHLRLLHGAPDERRAYLDDLLEQLRPGFAVFRKNYRRIVAQRNALLKRPHVAPGEFFPWDLRLSELGAVIARSRAELVDELQKRLPALYQLLAHSSDEVSVRYTPQFAIETYETALLHKLEEALPRDMARGFTAYGPHREDFTVYFGDRPAGEVASRGEVRTVVLALKIIELELLETALNTKPILLLDDVFSELDGARRRALTDYLTSHQTFLTTTDADIVVKHFTASTIIPLG